MKVKKILIIFLIISELLIADTFSEQRKQEEENKNRITKQVWETQYDKLLMVPMSLNDDNILTYNKSGIITLYLSSDLMNIDLNEIYKYIKFDVSVDKEKIYKCEFNKKNHKNCNIEYYTANAADELGGGLFSAGKALFDGKLMIEKKFDKYAFSKIIVKNELFLKQFINRFILKELNKENIINVENNTLQQKKNNDTSKSKVSNKKITEKKLSKKENINTNKTNIIETW